MTNKLTKERLDKLIMEVLDNEPLDVGIKITRNKLQAPAKEEKPYKDLIALLQKALNDAGIKSKELKFLAGMATNNDLSEDKNELDIVDIEKLFKIGTNDPSHLDQKVAGTRRKPIDPFDIAKKVDVALDAYIDKAIELQVSKNKINALLNVKREFPKMIARDKSYNPDDDTGVKTFEIPRSGQLDVASSGVKKAKIDPKLVETFSKFFAGDPDLKSRIKRLSDFSDKFIKNKNISLEDFANGAPILKIMSNITRQFNATSGGTEMEATLALIASGEKIGGSNGAGDFEGVGGRQYSAKWVQASTKIQQASFEKVLQKTPATIHNIMYIIGVKAGDSGAVAGVSQNMLQTTSVAIYLVEFTYTPVPDAGAGLDDYAKKAGYLQQLNYRTLGLTKGICGHITAKSLDGKKIGKKLAIDTKQIRVGKAEENLKVPIVNKNWIANTLDTKSDAASIISKLGKPVGIIKFVDGDTKTFSDQYGQYVENTKEKAIQYMSNINKKLNIISDSTLDFATDKTLNSAYSMSDNYNTMKDDMKNLFNEVSGEKTQVASKVGLSEKNQTKSLKDLDKLIERVIIESMNKK